MLHFGHTFWVACGYFHLRLEVQKPRQVTAFNSPSVSLSGVVKIQETGRLGYCYLKYSGHQAELDGLLWREGLAPYSPPKTHTQVCTLEP